MLWKFQRVINHLFRSKKHSQYYFQVKQNKISNLELFDVDLFQKKAAIMPLKK